jgi:uncharacterized protein (DUF362 family)
VAASAARGAMKGSAYLGRLSTRSLDDYAMHIRNGLKFTRFGSGLPRDPRIFVKPNLTFPTYRPGVMTSPLALEAALLALLEYTPRIWLGDSDSGGYNPFSMDEVYKRTGIAEFASRHGVKLVNLSKVERRSISLPIRGRERTLELPRLLTDEIDMLITMPVPKVHLNTGVSLTFKNQWGCIPEPSDRLRLHPQFGPTILAVNEAVKAGFAIIDGTFGLNGSGPLRGDPVALNWIAVTDSIGAGARLACELMQVPLRSIKHLALAEKRGLIPTMSQIETNADPASFVGPKFVLKRQWTDLPGVAAFNSRALAQVAYFSPLAGPLHKLLYMFREPFYDYHAK